MRNLFSLIVLSLATGVAFPAAAQTKLLTLKGTCQHLSGPGLKSGPCHDTLMNTSYPDGRSGLYFVSRDKQIITFSGMGKHQVKQGEDAVVQPVDLIVFGNKGNTRRLQAVGSCRFTNPYAGRATVECEATAQTGQYRASFISDGSTPTVLDR
ncbi:MAG: hypothetical protein BGP04_01125 [Rhizobiales bacterium 62-17]|nr:hypothetical protein [Hyphomicrobiales bacterium]OJY04612.1 MAG: hypothetical protein BGP04_01125 [Rhizobiales bacterium 62-17]